MTRIVDLTFPIEPHFRWPFERRLIQDFAKGDAFQVTWLGIGVHGFTHVDAPRHMLADGATTSATPLQATVGEAAVIDLTDVAADAAIGHEQLAARGSHVQPGDIVLLKTCWDDRRSLGQPEFWTEAPYLDRGACEWLLARSIRALGVDFPQDYPIRGLLSGKTASMDAFVSHDVLLRNGVILIEYLCNLASIEASRVEFVALPLKLPNADGAPARAVALLR